MSVTGRKPRPAALRELLGKRTRPYHHDRPPSDADDPEKPPTELPTLATDVPAPTGLTKVERVFWNQYAPLLAGAKMLTPADEQTLADYCRACACVAETLRRRRTAWRKRRPDIRLIRMLDSQARGWMDRKTKLAGELGLTAVARTRTAWSGHEQDLTKKPTTTKRPVSKVAKLQAQARELRRPLALPTTSPTPREGRDE